MKIEDFGERDRGRWGGELFSEVVFGLFQDHSVGPAGKGRGLGMFGVGLGLLETVVGGLVGDFVVVGAMVGGAIRAKFVSCFFKDHRMDPVGKRRGVGQRGLLLGGGIGAESFLSGLEHNPGGHGRGVGHGEGNDAIWCGRLLEGRCCVGRRGSIKAKGRLDG